MPPEVIFFSALRASLTRLCRVARSLRSQKKKITSGTAALPCCSLASLAKKIITSGTQGSFCIEGVPKNQVTPHQITKRFLLSSTELHECAREV